MTRWTEFDTGSEKLILVGPSLEDALPLSLLPDVPQIALDGGIHFAADPILWVGDGDLGPLPPAHIPSFFKKNQDMTDFRFCLEGIRPWRWTELHLLGFLGERKDHELANLGEIHAEMKVRPSFVHAVFYDRECHPALEFFQAGTHEVTLQGIFSVLVMERAEVTITGACRYPAERIELLPFSGRGVSNEGFGAVKISSTTPFIVIPASARGSGSASARLIDS